MPSTYRCTSCNATWSADREPTGCPDCGSRSVELEGHAGAPLDDYYQPPRASLHASGPVSSASFSVAYWLGWAGFIAGAALIGGAGDENSPLPLAGGLTILAAGVCLAAAYIGSLVKLYRGWDLIQPLRRMDRQEMDMPTPGKAVGFLFIPFYNLYWQFVAWSGLPTRAEKYMRRSGIDARPMGQGLPKAYCILMLCSIIPILGSFFALVNVVIYYLVILDLDRMRNAILAGKGVGGKANYVDQFEGL